VVDAKTLTVECSPESSTTPAGSGRRRAIANVQVPAPFDYERTTSVEHAIARLEELGPGARPLAGGHSLLPGPAGLGRVPRHVAGVLTEPTLRSAVPRALGGEPSTEGMEEV
jgi:hypothetical protein